MSKTGEISMRHGRLLLFLLLATLMLTALSAGLAHAADDPAGSKMKGYKTKADHALKDKDVSSGHDEHKGGEKGPPIFLPVRIDLAIWTLVVFLLLLFVLSKYAWNPMLGALQKREDNIRSAIDEAQRARDEAHKLREQFQAEIDRAHEKVRDMLDEARRNSQKTHDDLLAKARADVQAERDRLHREIESAKDAALKQLWDQTAQLATLVSAKAIRRQLTPDDHHRLVEDALADLRGSSGVRTG
jgi:F-type H+-transporting ATPase subunit b